MVTSQPPGTPGNKMATTQTPGTPGNKMGITQSPRTPGTLLRGRSISTDEEQLNFSKISRMVIDVAASVSRDFLDTFVDPKNLTPIPKNVKLNKEQQNILSRVPCLGNFNECDFSFQYSILRVNLDGKFDPTHGWGKVNTLTNKIGESNQTPGDDLERIRLWRNKLAHVATASFTENEYEAWFDDMKTVLGRFDGCHGNMYKKTTGAGSYVTRIEEIDESVMNPEMIKMYSSMAMDFAQLNAEMANVKTELTSLKETMENISVVQNGKERKEKCDSHSSEDEEVFENQDLSEDMKDQQCLIEMERYPMANDDATITDISSKIFDEPSTREVPVKRAETREKVRFAESGLTSSRTREKLALLEAELERKRNESETKSGKETSSRTREKLALLEAELEKKSNEIKTKSGTTSRTRERLALLEAELASKEKRSSVKGDGTTSRTRERLAEVEKQLASSRLNTSTKTRERLIQAEKELADLNIATSSKTKEKLAKVEAAIRKEREKKTTTMTKEMFRKKQELLQNLLNENSSVDVVFLIDCTGSMASYINETKNDIQGIVATILGTFENKMRLAFIGYRDHCDGPRRIEYLEFTENVEEFKSFVSNVRADGGGDAPEDVLGGLEAALNLSWSSKNKVLFHIGDAPQHGPRFHDMNSSADNYYDAEPRGLQVEDLLKTLKHIGIKYYFGKINHTTDKMIEEFKRVGGDDIVETTDMKTPNLMSMVVVESVTATIDMGLSKTMKNVRDARFKNHLSGISEESESDKTLKDYSISDADPDYSSMKTDHNVRWLECYIPPLDSLSDIKTHIGTINHKWTTAVISQAQDPFAEGAQRISYHAYRMFSEFRQNIVLKEFKHFGKNRDHREDYIEIMETQAVSAFLAQQFNQVSPGGSKEIQFLHVSVMQVFKSDGAPKYYNSEVLIPEYKENFKKWNSNAGYVSEKIYSSTLDAFSHWTYDVTGGFLLVVDLQGVDRDDKYILTDPSVHCIEPRFGLTNLGEVGIKAFFRTHSCSEVCQAMGMKKNKYMRPSTPARISAALTRVVGWS